MVKIPRPYTQDVLNIRYLTALAPSAWKDTKGFCIAAFAAYLKPHSPSVSDPDCTT